jgi:hypothetical protein
MTFDENEILIREEELRLADASAAPDTSEILDPLLADDVLIIGPQGEFLDKAFLLDAHRAPKKQAFLDVKLSELKLKTLDDQTAVVCCRGDYKLANHAFSLRFLRVWRKVNDDWKVVAGSVSLLTR